MNINGDLGAEPSPPRPSRPYPDYTPKKPSLLKVLKAWFSEWPVVVVTPYQFRLEPSKPGGRAGAELVLHIRERKGELRIRLDVDQLVVLEKVLGEVKR